jgi:hypothetical protein
VQPAEARFAPVRATAMVVARRGILIVALEACKK